MRLAVFFIATMAYAQSEMGTSAIRIMPRAADSDTGSVRFYDLTGTYRTDVRAQASQVANKILRMPSENGIIVGTENHRYGSDTFTITGFKARGTEASPSNVSAGDVLFQFMGQARVGGSFTNAGSITFATDAVTPSLDTSVNFGLTVGGSYGTRFAMDKASFYGIGRPTLGITAAAGRWGTLYGDSADLLAPTGTTPAFETGSFVRTQTLGLYDIGGQNGGWELTTENEVAGDSFLRFTDAAATDFARFYRKRANTAVDFAEWYADMLPDSDLSASLGNATQRWNNIHGRYVFAHTTLSLGSTHKVNISTDGSMSGDYAINFPPANASGCLSNDGSGDLSWAACSGGGSGSAPLDEVKITDYGADDTCATNITAGSPSPWTQARDAVKVKGGIITFPPGCFQIAASLISGNSAGTNESTEGTIYLRGAGAAYNPSGLAPNTEIRWDSATVPGSATPMVQFSGPINAGGIEGILLNANNTANVYYVNQRHHAYGTFRNVWAKRSPVSPSWIVTTSSNTYPYGSCYNRYDQLHITNDGVSGAGGMYLTGATGSGRDACSNLFTDGEIWYDSDTAGTYGVKLDYADNNTFLRFNLFRTSSGPGALESAYNSGSAWAVSCNTSTDYCTLGASNSNIVNGSRVRFSYTGSLPTGIAWAFPYFVINKSGNSFQVSTTSGGSAVDMTTTGSNVIVFLINPGVLLERYSGDTSFPKENAWYSSAIHNGVWSPNPPTGGNDFPEFQPDDCYVSPCIPNLDYVWGKAKGQMLGSGATPPGVEVGHSDSQNTFRINQSSNANGAGSIAFQRQGATLGRIRANYFDGLVFSTSQSGGTLTERWKITSDGNLFPMVDGTTWPTIGDVSNPTAQVWSRAFRAYTANSLGAQSHILYGDHNVNLDLKAYGSTGNDYRAGINFYRARNTVASPLPIDANDRLGVMAFWYNTGSGSESMSVGGRIQMIADAYSGGAATTSLRFHTANAGTEALQWKITGAGNFLPTGTSLTIGDSSGSAHLAHVYSQNYRVEGSGGAVYPSGNGNGSVGTSSFRFGAGYLDNVYSKTQVELYNGAVNVNQGITLTPAFLQQWDTSGNSMISSVGSTGITSIRNLAITNAAVAPNGVGGLTATYTCSVPPNLRLNISYIQISGGLITNLNALCGP